MKRINKTIFGLFLIWSVVVILAIKEYLTHGTIQTKWGVITGESAFHALIAYCVLAILFSLYSFKRTPREKKNEEN